MSERAAPAVRRPVHGGLDPGELRRLGLDPSAVLDFSASINPLGPPPGVIEAVRGADISAYPDRECLALREALSERLGVGIDRLLVGNGSTDLVHLLARICISHGTRILLFAPTFGEYEAAALAAGDGGTRFRVGCRRGRGAGPPRPAGPGVPVQPQQPNGGLPWRGGGHCAGADRRRRRPARRGRGLPRLRRRSVGPRDALRGPERRRAPLHDQGLRLAGLRPGYLVGPAPLVARLRAAQPSWSVNALAQAAGVAALRDQGHLERARAVVRDAKRFLTTELRGLGLDVLPSAANFLLVRVGDAATMRDRLLRRGVCVRACTDFGLPEHVRVGVRTPAECALLVRAVRETLADG